MPTLSATHPLPAPINSIKETTCDVNRSYGKRKVGRLLGNVGQDPAPASQGPEACQGWLALNFIAAADAG